MRKIKKIGLGTQKVASTRRSRRRAVIAIAGLIVGATAVVPLTASFAEDGPYAVETPAQVPDDGATQIEDPEGNVKELGPVNSNTTKIGVIHDDAVPTLDLTNPNARVDLRQARLDVQRDPITNDDWLYFAWERDKATGSGFIAYEFMQEEAPVECAYDTATQDDLIDFCNPWANRRSRRLHDPVGPAGREPGPVPAQVDRHRRQPWSCCRQRSSAQPIRRRHTAPTASWVRRRST
ncbi:hypothetical protein [Nocardioides sp. B-3]|uniref:hypothetical protein n=1 Tax=Nocardioides sp. B-3 TaxID=2895565 RepID=UPI002152D75F|nr:hypothetical protein [Nocardioides sp. B-3]UUZ58663.1 hypothetical protein LP418_21470 [Nocardioides sp. B-3]